MPSAPHWTSAAPHGPWLCFEHDQHRELLLGPQMSRFRGVQVDLVNVPNFCVKRALNLYVSAAKSAQARNTESGLCFFSFRMVCPPSALASWGQIELQGVGLVFGRISLDPARF